MLKESSHNIFHKFRCLTFNRKISAFLIFEILFISFVVLIITAISSWMTIRNKTIDLAMKQIDLTSNTLGSTLKGIDDNVEMLMCDSRIQQYLQNVEGEDDNSGKSISITNQVNNALSYMASMKSEISYLSVINYLDNNMIYTGAPLLGSNFVDWAKKDYESAMKTSYGTMRTSVTHKIFYPNEYSLNIYQPLYDKYELNTERGLLCISIDEKDLNTIYDAKSSDIPFDIFLTDRNGKIISNKDQSLISTKCPYASRFVGEKGYFQSTDQLVFYQYVKSWNWYVVGSIKNTYLYSDTYFTILVLLILTVFMCMVGVLISIKLSNSLYRPLKDLVHNMDMVSNGDLKVRMNHEYSGNDFRQLATGFNEMLDEIEFLMIKVKIEQHQIEQIKLNALQAQIKPHFLYNTLECIHWQALSDGNEKVSKMVKALAKYYRLCLSSGHDIIPLSQEIEHIRSYLIIQNMRYGDIIESRNEIEDRFNNVQIPKMTLQPLVENSINHGINVKEGHKGILIIRAAEEEDSIVISLADSGTGMTQEKIDEINNSLSEYNEDFGYGVQNVHKRIQLLFGDPFGLYYRQNEFGGITVDIRLPKQ